jgi:hypothetical protein
MCRSYRTVWQRRAPSRGAWDLRGLQYSTRPQFRSGSHTRPTSSHLLGDWGRIVRGPYLIGVLLTLGYMRQHSWVTSCCFCICGTTTHNSAQPGKLGDGANKWWEYAPSSLWKWTNKQGMLTWLRNAKTARNWYWWGHQPMIPEKHTQQPVWPNMGNIANMTYEMLPKRRPPTNQTRIYLA